MSRAPSEHSTTRRRLREVRALLDSDKAVLKNMGLKPEEIKRVLNPLHSFHDGMKEKLDHAERFGTGW